MNAKAAEDAKEKREFLLAVSAALAFKRFGVEGVVVGMAEVLSAGRGAICDGFAREGDVAAVGDEMAG